MQYHELLSIFAFNLNLRRHISGLAEAGRAAPGADGDTDDTTDNTAEMEPEQGAYVDGFAGAPAEAPAPGPAPSWNGDADDADDAE